MNLGLLDETQPLLFLVRSLPRLSRISDGEGFNWALYISSGLLRPRDRQTRRLPELAEAWQVEMRCLSREKLLIEM